MSPEEMEKAAEKKKLGEELKQFNKALVKVQDQYLEEAKKNKADGAKPTQKQKDLQKEMKEMQATHPSALQHVATLNPLGASPKFAFAGAAGADVGQATVTLGGVVAGNGDRHPQRAQRA